MWRPDRARASVIRKATGAIVQRSPGRARHKPFKPLRREGRDVPGCPVLRYAAAHAVCPWHGGPREPTGSWPSLRPLSMRAKRSSKARAKRAARMRSRVCRIAGWVERSETHGAAPSGAMQSRGPCCSVCAAPGSRLCAAAQERCSASGTREIRAQSPHTPSLLCKFTNSLIESIL
jgi:hypothetical protein